MSSVAASQLTRKVTLSELLADGVKHRWLPCLGLFELLALTQSCASVRDGIESPLVWEEVARSWRLVDAENDREATPGADPPPWRSICMFHEKMWHAWRGSPTSMRLNLREELRRQRIADLDVLIVTFIAGEDAFALGHANGVVSIWELCRDEYQLVGSSAGSAAPNSIGSTLQDGSALPSPQSPVSPGSGAAEDDGSPSERHTFQARGADTSNSRSPTAWDGRTGDHPRSPLATPKSSPAYGAAGRPGVTSRSSSLNPRVLGVFHTVRSDDVEDLAVWPPAVSEPSATALGHSIWLAAAVGATAFVWQSAGDTTAAWETGRQVGFSTRALTQWKFRGALRHSRLFNTRHHFIVSVRLGTCATGSAACNAVTISDDCWLRAWQFGASEDGCADGTLIWQLAVGDARQAVVAILSRPPSADHIGDVLALARADRRTLQFYDYDSGKEAAQPVDGVWPRGSSSMPQAATYDTSGLKAFFSSITEAGNGALTCVDLASRLADAAAFDSDTAVAAASEAVAGSADVEDGCLSKVLGPLSGKGRVLRMAVAVPPADAIVAVVQESLAGPVDLMEVWEREKAFGEVQVAAASCEPLVCASPLPPGCGSEGSTPALPTTACFRTKVPHAFANPRLVGVGGRRMILLDPSVVAMHGELRLLEWRHLKAPARGAKTAARVQATGGLCGGACMNPSTSSRRVVATDAAVASQSESSCSSCWGFFRAMLRRVLGRRCPSQLGHQA
eukprot:TRINITY_DN6042_c0_g1_i1.p1 TRINITY_DN6042_c0_g1~~TRINITY_DN6042_c0_g1_i1.p1  ORF type:complete len:734 (+),score=109.53 TRINITY_DN6042_c0_g1_i1:109-2310(+)